MVPILCLNNSKCVIFTVFDVIEGRLSDNVFQRRLLKHFYRNVKYAQNAESDEFLLFEAI